MGHSENIENPENPIEKLSIEELDMEIMRLKDKLDSLKEEIDQLEEKKKQLSQEGIGSDVSKKKILAKEIKALGMEIKSKYETIPILHEQLFFSIYLLIIKKREEDLRNSGVWDKIIREPGYMIAVAIDLILSGEAIDEVVKAGFGYINGDVVIFSESMLLYGPLLNKYGYYYYPKLFNEKVFAFNIKDREKIWEYEIEGDVRSISFKDNTVIIKCTALFDEYKYVLNIKTGDIICKVVGNDEKARKLFEVRGQIESGSVEFDEILNNLLDDEEWD